MTTTAATRRMNPVGNIRWLMVFLVFAIAAVSYLDRSNISIAAPVLKQDFALTDIQLGLIFSAFVWGYALFQPFAGRLADRFGPDKVVSMGIVWWSALTVLTALIPLGFGGAFVVLLLVRFILGVGESVIFPAGNRLVASWIPSHERGLANGIIFAGVGVGAAVAPLLMTNIMLHANWRWAFHACALIGVVALGVWIALARARPAQHPWVKADELDYIAADTAIQVTAGGEERLASWGAILRDRQVRVLTLSYFCFGYVVWIFFSWFFTYLSVVRGLDLKSSGIYGTLPFIAMAIGSPLGGWLSDLLCRRYSKRTGRCLPAAFGMGLAAVFVAVATQVADARLAAIVLALGSGSIYLAQSAFWTLSADLGRASAGSVSGVMNMGCQIGGATVAALTPVLSAQIGWSGSFLVAAAAALIGAICWLFVDPNATLVTNMPERAREAAA